MPLVSVGFRYQLFRSNKYIILPADDCDDRRQLVFRLITFKAHAKHFPIFFQHFYLFSAVKKLNLNVICKL